MSSRALKLALIASVGVNLFALVVGLILWFGVQRAETEAGAQRQAIRQEPVMALVGQLEPQRRAEVRQALRASALAAKADFEAARAARREAVAGAAAETFDQARVQALLEQSRLAEMRGRARLESGAVEVLAGLDQSDRAALAPLLSRHRGGRRNGEPRPEVPPPALQRPQDQPAR